MMGDSAMTERTPLIAGNWKMYKTLPEAVQTAKELVGFLTNTDSVEVMIAPTFTSLAAVGEVLKSSSVALGAQNLHWETEGAFTGEISAPMLLSVGCRYVIIGHSERRQYFGETDETVNRRIRAALDAGLRPILCVGETEGERDRGETFSVLDKQMQDGLKDFVSEDLGDLVVAYEPVWAIGTGKTATAEQAQEVHRHLRQYLETAFDKSFSGSVRILYGGSVKPDNVADLMAQPDLDGALVGGASLKAESFSKIANYSK